MAAQDHTPQPHRGSASFLKIPLLFGSAFAAFCLSSCSSTTPKGVVLAKNFDPLRFEGTWYELARTNHPDEAGLTRVSANYKRKSDGSWLISDRAWSNAEGMWLGSERKAKSGKSPAVFKLRHANPRNVVVIDPEHTMALACSNTYRQFWILSKNPDPEPGRFDRMISVAQEAGFPVKELITLPTR
jgi:apolipoprotein D and lipocalin family protein